MPTSKDLLAHAKKTLDDHAPSEMAVNDALKTAKEDIANYVKARHTLALSISSIDHHIGVIVDDLSDLNKGLSELQKTEPVMKAPVDAKVYKALVDAYTGAIRDGMEFHNKLKEQLKDAKARYTAAASQ